MSTLWDMYDSFCSGSGEVKEDIAIPLEQHKAVVPDVSSVSLQTHPKDSSNIVSMISIGDYYKNHNHPLKNCSRSFM